MTTWIAEERVVFLHADGRRTPGRIAIAAPVEREQDCACVVALDGLEAGVTIFGDSTLQALLLSAQYLGISLPGFLSRGGRVLWPPDHGDADGPETDLDLTDLFGPLLRQPKPASPHDPSEK